MSPSHKLCNTVIQPLNHFLMCASKMHRKKLTYWSEPQKRLTEGKAINKIVSNLYFSNTVHFKGNIMRPIHINSPTGEDFQLFRKPSNRILEKKISKINQRSLSPPQIGSATVEGSTSSSRGGAVYSLTRYLSHLDNLNFGVPINQSHC